MTNDEMNIDKYSCIGRIDFVIINLMRPVYAVNIGQEFWIKVGSGIGSNAGYSSIGQLIGAILPNIYIVAGIILLIFLIAGGFSIISASGKGLTEGVEKGTKVITGALIGFLILFASYWIIQIVEKVTGLKIFESSF